MSGNNPWRCWWFRTEGRTTADVGINVTAGSALGVGKPTHAEPGLSAGSCTASGLASTGGLLVGLCLCLRAPAQCLPFFTVA